MRIIQGLAWFLVCVLFVVAGAFAWGRLRSPTAAQSRALALLHLNLRPTTGRNAFPVQWFADFDVPDDQLDTAYGKELKRARDWVAEYGHANSFTSMPPPKSAFPELPRITETDKDLLCGLRETNCIAKIRLHREAVRAAVYRYRTRLENDEALSSADQMWSDMPPNPLVATPPYGASFGLWPSSIALDFIDGRQAGALEQACTQVLTMRRLHAHTNTLISSMVLAVRTQAAVHLFTELVAEVPPQEEMPARCAQAFAPVQFEDVDLCASAQSEYAHFEASLGLAGDHRWYESLTWSPLGTKRMMARRYGGVCEPALTPKLLGDHPVDLADQTPRADLFDLISNPAGSVLVRIGDPRFDKYPARQQDVAAALRIGATVLWLRETRNNGMALRERLGQRPAWMHVSDDRHLRLSADERSLVAGLHDSRKEWPTAWPLPVNL